MEITTYESKDLTCLRNCVTNMLSSAQLIIYADAQIGMACCDFNWSTVHIISHQQGIPFMFNMHDIAFIDVKFHLPFGFPVTKNVYILL